MYYTVYKATNTVNGKFYIGTHKTTNPNDDYMGSGKYLRHAIDKYGIQCFEKEVLWIFNNPEDMYAKEAEIVNEEFLAEENTYNLKIGGMGGWDFINSNDELRVEKNRKARKATNTKHGHKLSEWGKEGGKATFKKHGISEELRLAAKTAFKGKKHTDEAKKKIGEANSKLQNGKQNSQYGTCWITNGSESKKIKRDQPLPQGWEHGRIIKRR